MKTNFITNLKQFLFLVIAVIGTFVSYGQPTQNSTTTVDTGGSKGTGTSSDTGQFNDNDFDPYDTGGKNSTGGIEFAQVSFDTGGGSKGTSTTGDFTDDDFDNPYFFETGGRNGGLGTGELAISYLEYLPGTGCIFDTGGDKKGTSSGTGQVNDSDDSYFYETGGRSGGLGDGDWAISYLEYLPGVGCTLDTGVKGHGTSTTGDVNDDDTGGKSGDNGTGQYEVSDTGGGRNTNSTGEYCLFDTGGKGNELGTGGIFVTE